MRRKASSGGCAGRAIAVVGREGERAAGMKKARHLSISGSKQNYLTAYGLLAVGNGQAACGFRVV